MIMRYSVKLNNLITLLFYVGIHIDMPDEKRKKEKKIGHLGNRTPESKNTFTRTLKDRVEM